MTSAAQPGQRHAGRLGDERHRAAGARVDFEDVDDRLGRLLRCSRPLLTANCTFIRPLTFSSRAMARVCRLISSMTAGGRLCGGMTQAESPEWMPASSMCCITPPMSVRVPSLRQSTSTSMAASRNLSIRIGLPGDTSMAWST